MTQVPTLGSTELCARFDEVFGPILSGLDPVARVAALACVENHVDRLSDAALTAAIVHHLPEAIRIAYRWETEIDDEGGHYSSLYEIVVFDAQGRSWRFPAWHGDEFSPVDGNGGAIPDDMEEEEWVNAVLAPALGASPDRVYAAFELLVDAFHALHEPDSIDLRPTPKEKNDD